LKIALIGPSAPWRGGIAHYTSRLFHELDAEGHDVRLFNFRRLYPALLFPGRTQVDESEVRFDVPSRRTLDPLDPLSWLDTARQILEFEPDRVVLQWWHPYFAPGYRAVAEACRWAGVHVVMQCHNVEPHESTLIDRWLLQLAYRGADAYVVQSTPERERLGALLGSEPPVRIAPHPPYDQFELDGRGAPAWREHLDLGHEHIVLFFGLVRRYKGVDVLIEAMAHLPDAMDVALVVAGEHYEETSRYADMVEALGLTDRVCLYDAYVPNEDVAGLFELADVCVLPYRHATGSGVANIAVAHGVSLVMSDLPDLRDAFGDQARWFGAEDPRALARELEAALGGDTQVQYGPRGGWRTVVDAITANPS
jgi:glycosyltransferase involved in cell wall biosynthesis